MTNGEKETIYQNILDKTYYRCGIVTKVSGLGGGATLGYAEHILRDYLIILGTGGIIGHEIGHTVGFTHSSNMTYPIQVDNVNVGISPLTNRVMKILIEENRFPITSTNYYLAEDFQASSSQSNMKTSIQSQHHKCVEIHVNN